MKCINCIYLLLLVLFIRCSFVKLVYSITIEKAVLAITAVAENSLHNPAGEFTVLFCFYRQPFHKIVSFGSPLEMCARHKVTIQLAVYWFCHR